MMNCRTRIAGQCLLVWGLVGLADFVFFDRLIGWPTGLFAVGAAGSYLLARWDRLRHARWGGGIALAVLGMAIAFLIEPSMIALLMMLGLLVALPILEQCGWSDDGLVWLRRWASLTRDQVARLPRDIRHTGRSGVSCAKVTADGLTWARGLAVPAVLTVIFLALFMLGNPLVARGFENAVEWAGEFFNVGRMFFWVVVFICGWGYLRGRVSAKARGAMASDLPASEELKLLGQRVPIVASLVMFNAVFMLQTVLDLIYLWGGAAMPKGMSHSEYAHRGAYPLIATALLAGLFVLLTFGEGRASERNRLARGLVFAWLAQNVLLVASSLWRLHVYVDAFLLTRLRLAAAVWMGLVALGLCLIAWRIARGRSNAWLVRMNAGAAFAVLYVAPFVNEADLIARHNISHARELQGRGGELDVDYFEMLGMGALPAMQEAMKEMQPMHAQYLPMHRVYERMMGELLKRQRPWRTWTVRGAMIMREVGMQRGGDGG